MLASSRIVRFCLYVLISCVALAGVPGLRANDSGAFDAMVRLLLGHTVPEVSVGQLTNPNVFQILDTRERAEYEVSHLAGSVWVGSDDFQLNRIQHLSKTSRILVYCSVGYRSEKVGEKILAAGYRNVKNLTGGIFAWVNAGRPVYDSAGKITDKVHGYSQAWGVWLRSGKVVYR